MTKPAAPVSTPSAVPSTPSGSRVMGWALAAAAGLSLAACNQSEDKPTGEKAAASTTAEKACCHGKNECKGKGGCAVPGKNDCAGKNACKGQGGCNMNCPK